MDKKYLIIGNMPLKIVNIIMVILLSFAVLFNLVAMIIMDQMGIYSETEASKLSNYYNECLRTYSVGAVIQNEKNYGYEDFKDTNFRYGIIKGDFDESMFSDLSNYEFTYFDEAFDKLKDNPNNFCIYSCNFDENSVVDYNPNIFGTAYIGADHGYESEYHTVTNVYYDWQTGSLYLLADGALYPYNGTCSIVSDEMEEDEVYYSDSPGSSFFKGLKLLDDEYNWDYPEGTRLVLDEYDYTIQLKDVFVFRTEELEKCGRIIDDDISYGMSKGRITTTTHLYTGPAYYVVSYVADPLTLHSDFFENDLFGQWKIILDTAYKYKNSVAIFAVISIVLWVASFTFAVVSSGRRTGEEKLVGHFWDAIPIDILFVITGGLVCTVIGAVSSYIAESFAVNRNFFNPFIYIIVVAGGIFCVAMFLVYTMSLSFHIKEKRFLKSHLCIMIWYYIFKGIGWILSKLFAVLGNTHLAIMAILGLIVFTVEQIFAFAICGSSRIFILIIFFEIVFSVPVIGYFLYMLDKLSKGTSMIVNGNIDYKIDTKYMTPFMKKHGEQINSIGAGLNEAVAEKVKSETFKTELITNVSHDIKTPLTSIINYVDLLEKEDINNERVNEYLEVLSRQSAKLKKLIEDLIEASKASTGNLTVNMTELDVSVVMEQVVGEFEEKLEKSNVELIIDKPDSPVIIQADPRHLWRVFDNLLNNICKYAMPGTRAYINVEEDQEIKIIFKNISKEPLNISSEQLLERFVRADASRNTEGNGLGLSIAQSLMELMNGKLILIVDGDLFKAELVFSK